MDTHEWLRTIQSVVSKEQHPISNLANIAALLWDALEEINWAGFYLLHEGALWLGPFHGKVACTRIQPGHGVCGTALLQNKTIVVPDVHLFPGHIACDAASRSEIVVPLHVNGVAVAVLDIDSPICNRFTKSDQDFVEQVAGIIEQHVHLHACGFDLHL